jgi:glucosamine-6-phosphate deaminase
MLDVRHCTSPSDIGANAAVIGAQAIRSAIAQHGTARVIVATGASQFTMLEALVADRSIDWSRVTVFHLDEYVGLAESHKASFRGYLQTRFLAKLPVAPRFVPVVGDSANLASEIARLNALIGGNRIDVCFAGIGENCHLAFNDPPADFTTEAPYLVVTLDEACRRQQLGEGWFDNLESVPTQAISMSIRQIMRSELIVLSVPDARKAAAVKAAVEGPVSPLHPASILQQHDNAVLFLDPQSASLLGRAP